ncbi:putative nuclease YhcG [bioreactor metagenome]|uniref:Putative nuclease YhcG n=1 Tax=bioreactor metagenome TaxID=1076179 RepID=A0A645HAX6_9ZZZZ
MTEHIQKFLLELGRGFAFVGRQYPLSLDNQDFAVDMLFYHLKLRCYVVIDLKIGKFLPEYAGKMNFYCNLVDAQMKYPADNPTIGLILCQDENRIIAEYTLQNIQKPIGIAEYELVNSIPDELKTSLPSIEEIESELSDH